MTEPNTKRKLISKRLVDISSLVAELRKKNPYERLKLEKSESVCYCYDNGYNKAVDELERLLKVKEAKEILSGKGLGKRIFEKVRKVKK